MSAQVEEKPLKRQYFEIEEVKKLRDLRTIVGEGGRGSLFSDLCGNTCHQQQHPAQITCRALLTMQLYRGKAGIGQKRLNLR